MSTTTYTIHLARRSHGRVELCAGPAPAAAAVAPQPARVARLLALAHRLDHMVRSGQVADYAEIAELAGVTRARVSQLTNLLLLAPDIQEAVLDMLRPATGREPVGEQHLRPITLEPDWRVQRAMFAAVLKR